MINKIEQFHSGGIAEDAESNGQSPDNQMRQITSAVNPL